MMAVYSRFTLSRTWRRRPGRPKSWLVSLELDQKYQKDKFVFVNNRWPLEKQKHLECFVHNSFKMCVQLFDDSLFIKSCWIVLCAVTCKCRRG